MEDGHQAQDSPNSPNHGGSGSNSCSERNNNEPVRSRWTPKPEQILILESIFNSGMVNPPKDETVRIRKLLEKFGSVGDANVFYWFQNRRSRSRRRQRQIQASLTGDQLGGQPPRSGGSDGRILFDTSTAAFAQAAEQSFYSSPSSCFGGGCSSAGGGGNEGIVDDMNMYSYSGEICGPGIEQNPGLSSSINMSPTDTSNLHYQSGFITVFINGVATEIPKGAVDMKGMLGQRDLVLVHSSGVPVNDFSFPLQHGESYFLVSRPT